MKHAFPETGLVRLKDILGSPHSDPPIPPVIPLSRSAWLEGVRQKRYPQPIRIGNSRSVFWRASDIRALFE